MSYAPNVNIFRELQVLHDTGFLTGLVSPEEHWQQVRRESGGGLRGGKKEMGFCVGEGQSD